MLMLMSFSGPHSRFHGLELGGSSRHSDLRAVRFFGFEVSESKRFRSLPLNRALMVP